MSETLQLQVNTNGAWKTVIRFEDAEPGDNFKAVKLAGLYLLRAEPRAAFRVASCDSVPRALHFLDSADGLWHAIK